MNSILTESKYIVNKRKDCLQIIMPSIKSVPRTIFLGIWLCFWLFGEIGVIIVFLTQYHTFYMSLLAFVVIIFMSYYGFYAILSFLYLVIGQEVFEIIYDSIFMVKLSKRFTAFGKLIEKKYEVDEFPLVHCKNFRIRHKTLKEYFKASQTHDSEQIFAFEYHKETHCFGSGVTDYEAELILFEINSFIEQTKTFTVNPQKNNIVPPR